MEELFNSYYRGLCRFTARLVNSAEDVEDLVQEIFVRIWILRKGWHPHGTIKAYLFKAARNQAINFVKNKKSNSTSTVEAIDEFAAPSLSDPADETITNELELFIKRSIERLPKKSGLVFILNRQEGLSYSEIASVLGISIKTVENQIARALKYLRKDLADFIGPR